jgi:membrane protease YdiL (CAAX protease family)
VLPEKPWTPEGVLRLLMCIFLTVSAGILIMAPLAREAPGAAGDTRFTALLVGTLSFHGATLVFIAVFVRRSGVGWREAFGFGAPGRLRALGLAVLVCFAVFPFTWVLGFLSAEAMTLLGLKPVAQPAVQALQGPISPAARIYFAVMAIGVAPFAEELLFRGILYPTIKQRGYPRIAMWGTAAFFAATHANLMTFVPLMFLAVVLTTLYENTRNLLAPIVTHSLFNAVNFIWLVKGF